MKQGPFPRAGATALAIAAATVTLTTNASAQRSYDTNRGSPARNIAGQFDYYVMVMSWSPSFCASAAGTGNDLQCNRRDGKRYAFVLHGLWPQYKPRGWPQDCPVRGRPFVPRQIINGMMDIMPSDRLAIHEFRKHGMCSGLEPNAYFGLARQLYSSIKIPERYRNPYEALFLSPDEVAGDFLKANPHLKPDNIAISCGGPGKQLQDVRICFGKEGQPVSCSRNEDQGKMCSAPRMYVPPVRASRAESGRSGDTGPTSPLPAPRVIARQRDI